VQGVPVDFGPLFLHGAHPEFRAALAEVPDARDWPRRVQGSGQPCQPGALAPGLDRLAFPEGLGRFPRHLAQGLDLRLESEVRGLERRPGGFRLVLVGGAALDCRNLVLALALEEARALLAPLGAQPGIPGLLGLLGSMATVPCLTLMAGYPAGTPAPAWDILYPQDSARILLVAADSTKRPGPGPLTLVAQARPRWSRQRLEQPPESWSGELLEELAALAGPWAAEPSWRCPHQWRFARLDTSCELSGPLILEFPGDLRLGLAGEAFAPGGGVQAAYLSGLNLAHRLLGLEAPVAYAGTERNRT
jgi:predicted NAD/FAD-dependent oxidoreductase